MRICFSFLSLNRQSSSILLVN